VPDNEDERLVEATEYSELGVSGEFDRLTKIVQENFDVDMAFVGIVEGKYERSLSCHGAEVEAIPREETVCTYQILEDGVLVVENVLEDPRFEGRNTLRKIGMRFYAGAPLTSPSGTRVGPFCVVDEETRSFSEEDKNFLRLLADETVDKLNLLRRIRWWPKVGWRPSAVLVHEPTNEVVALPKAEVSEGKTVFIVVSLTGGAQYKIDALEECHGVSADEVHVVAASSNSPELNGVTSVSEVSRPGNLTGLSMKIGEVMSDAHGDRTSPTIATLFDDTAESAEAT